MGARLDALLAVVNSSEFNSDEAMDAFERREYDRVVEMTLFHAIAGNSNAQTQLSPLYQLGLGVERDVLEAERWLLKAAQQNNPVWSDPLRVRQFCRAHLGRRGFLPACRQFGS